LKKRLTLGGQALPLIIATGASQVVTAVLFIVAARLTSVQLFGLAATSVALGTVSSGLLDFGFNSFFTRELAAGRITLETYWAKAKTKITIAAVLAFSWFCIFVSINTILSMSSLIFFSVLLFQTLLVPLRAHSRGSVISTLVLVERFSAAGIFVIFIQLGPNPATSLIISLFAGTCGASYIAMNFVRTSLRASKVQAHRGLPWTGSRNYGLSAVSNSLQQLDLPLLALLGGSGMAGIYGAINKWTQPLGIVANAYATAATPFIAKSHSTRAAMLEIKKSAWIVGLSLVFAGAMVPAAPSLVDLLLGTSYEGAVPVFQLMAIGTIPAIINQVLATGLQARGFDKQVARVSISGVIVQLTLLALLAGTCGALGAASAYCALQTCVFLALFFLLIKKLRSEV